MKNFILFLLCCLVAPLAAHADDNTLVLHFTDGTEMRYILNDDTPVMTFEGDSIVVTTQTVGTTGRYDLTDVDYFKYEVYDANAIVNVNTGADGNGLSVKGNRVDISGLPAGSSVFIYDTVGKLYSSLKADAQGRCSLSLDNLARGVYIIKAYHISTKITKK